MWWLGDWWLPGDRAYGEGGAGLLSRSLNLVRPEKGGR
jgi:hypothetical protein